RNLLPLLERYGKPQWTAEGWREAKQCLTVTEDPTWWYFERDVNYLYGDLSVRHYAELAIDIVCRETLRRSLQEVEARIASKAGWARHLSARDAGMGFNVIFAGDV